MSHFNFTSTCYSVRMEAEQPNKVGKKGSSHRRRGADMSEFQSEITLQLDQFFREFVYYYPGKNKEEIINKCISGNTYWITIDSQYYAQNVDFQMSKIEQLRKKSLLKNGAYPPTKDALEEEKFILTVRKVISQKHNTLNLEDIRSTALSQVIDYLQEHLFLHETHISRSLEHLIQTLKIDNEESCSQLLALGIPPIKSARLFAYEMLEKEVINQSVQKALEKEKQPRCEFCFTRDKEIIVKCKICDLYVHRLCFAKVPKNGEDFVCDQCSINIPQNAQCELCPLQGGRFLELIDEASMMSYHISKGDSSLKFKITKERENGRKRQFIHISCFVLHPECNYNLAEGKVQGIHLIDRSKKNTSICLICGNMIGLTVPCNNQSCRRAYHPECAKRNNLKINVIKANNKSLLQIYCERHKKPESYEYLKDSVSNRIRELKKFYEGLDYEIRRYENNHGGHRQKKLTKTEQNLKMDLCLRCSGQNNYEEDITNCRRCYGWRHNRCSPTCPLCDL